MGFDGNPSVDTAILSFKSNMKEEILINGPIKIDDLTITSVKVKGLKSMERIGNVSCDVGNVNSVPKIRANLKISSLESNFHVLKGQRTKYCSSYCSHIRCHKETCEDTSEEADIAIKISSITASLEASVNLNERKGVVRLMSFNNVDGIKVNVKTYKHSWLDFIVGWIKDLIVEDYLKSNIVPIIEKFAKDYLQNRSFDI